MSDDLERYRKSPKDFRKQLWAWISKRRDWVIDSKQPGGELGLYIQQQMQRQATLLHQRLIGPTISAIGPRDRRRLLVVFVISLMAVMIQEPTKTGTKPTKTNTAIKIIRDIFENMESISLASAGIIFLLETRERQKKDSNELWQIIHSASAQKVSGARIKALEDLHKNEDVLEGIDLSGFDLSEIQLSSAKLMNAKFENTILRKANLKDADLQVAHLRGADLGQTNLQNARLIRTDLRETQLSQTRLIGANLGGALLRGANGHQVFLHGAYLRYANLERVTFYSSYLGKSCLAEADLTEAKLTFTDLTNANLTNAQLTQADLQGANLQGANLLDADLRYAKNITLTQLTETKLCRTILPEDIDMSLDSNRDCQELGINPETGNPLEN